MTKHFTLADASAASGIGRVDLTNWKHRGLMNGFGEHPDPTPWMFRFSDLCAIYLTNVVRPFSPDVAAALRYGHAYGPVLAAHLLGRGGALQWRFIALVTPPGAQGFDTLPLTSAADLAGEQFDLALVLDFASLARSAPASLRDAAAKLQPGEE